MKDALAIAQCAVNIESILRLYDLPALRVRDTLYDRTMFYRSEEFLWCLDKKNPYGLVAQGKFEPYDFVHNHGQSAERGWRERVAMYSLQVVQHVDGIEADVDIFNPNHGAGLAISHLGECFSYYILRRKTDPFRVLAGLRRRGLSVPDVRTGECT